MLDIAVDGVLVPTMSATVVAAVAAAAVGHIQRTSLVELVRGCGWRPAKESQPLRRYVCPYVTFREIISLRVALTSSSNGVMGLANCFGAEVQVLPVEMSVICLYVPGVPTVEYRIASTWCSALAIQ